MDKQQSGPVRVRFAPSPTGYLHIGGARTALYDWLLARQTGGQFILRIEDTDRSRYVEGGIEEQMAGLRWLGLEWDEGPDVGGPYGPYIQSQRLEIYPTYVQRLLDSGAAYEAYYSKDEIDALRQQIGEANVVEFNHALRTMPVDEVRRRREAGTRPAILFKMPDEGETVVYDEIRGAIRFANRTLRDPVLMKSDGYPTYHFAAMVDDALMKITHVMRGEEWLSSLPLHTLLIRAFGWEMPKFAHLSVFLDPSGKGKMSKRKAAAAGQPTLVRDFRESGYLPEAVLNWVALMGWAESGGGQEFYTIPELIQRFSLERLRPSPAAVNYDKAEWLNGVHIRALPPSELAERLVPFMREEGLEVTAEQVEPLVPLVQERITLLDDAPELLDFFFVAPPPPSVEELVPKRLSPEAAGATLQAARDLLATIEPYTAESIEAALRSLADTRGVKAGDLFTILRVALSSKRVAPPLFGTLEHLSRAVALERLDRALALLQPA